MDSHSVKCPVCCETNNTFFVQWKYHPTIIHNRLCHHCGIVFQSPRMSPEEANEFHKSKYREQHQCGRIEVDPREIVIQDRRAESMLDISKMYIKSVSSHLDIGCSGGSLMQSFQTHYHCATLGVEIDDIYRPYAQSRGLKVFASLEELPKGKRHDVISLLHVLEHIPQPIAFLVRLREEYLEADGSLFIEVPNLYIHDCFEPGHMISYSSFTLSQVLQLSGFKVVQCVIHGMPRSRLVPLYVNVIARPAIEMPIQIRRENFVYIRRKAGRLYRKLVEFLFPSQAKLKMF